MRATLRHQVTGGLRRGQVPRWAGHRWPRWVVASLLVLVPSGYFVVAAVQSHNAGSDAELRAEMAGLVAGRPSPVQRHIYRVPIPYNATRVAYFESNAWQTSLLYVQFTTTAGGLDAFLAQLGTSRAGLDRGSVAITPAQARRVDWRFVDGHDWYSATLRAGSGKPVQEITVNLDDPDRPVVYVVSTITFH